MNHQHIYRILAEALLIRLVPPSAVAGVATMGAFRLVIFNDISKMSEH